MSGPYDGATVSVVGGSIGGLTTALLLRDLGFAVSVFERSRSDLRSRGGGIVLQPEMLRWFAERSYRKPGDVSTSTHWVRYLGDSDQILHEEPAVWRYSSWSTLFGALLGDLGEQSYHLGRLVTGFHQDADSATVLFNDGSSVSSDLVIFADGIGSRARLNLNPGAKSEYQGYVGWRGAVHESLVSPTTFELLRDALSYSFAPNTHIVMYPIPGPGEGLQPGERLLNYVWYRNVDTSSVDDLFTTRDGQLMGASIAPGTVQERHVAEMRAATTELAPAMAEVVLRTEHPYIQRVLAQRSDRMVEGRVVVLGDAAFAGAPHAAAGTAKAVDDAWALSEALEAHGSVDAALAAWEPKQLAVGNALVDRVSAMGRAAQFANSWRPGDRAMRFGLHGPRSGSDYAPVPARA